MGLIWWGKVGKIRGKFDGYWIAFQGIIRILFLALHRRVVS
jgi:hypothetical protein